MVSREMYLAPNFATTPCPVCGGLFSKCGLPNHIRRHKFLATQTQGRSGINRKSPAWWDGWTEGYKLGMRDGANAVRKAMQERGARSSSQEQVDDGPAAGKRSAAHRPKLRERNLTRVAPRRA